ncbi:hypothetical protein BEK98_27770 [Streptomyces diastatochromogenes]|uniref:Uncharacterized protein n=1 Tax=Streptomyces diastatochromogenes TaxID=42236 RepID=A0A233S8A5_STRDA|nr:hypothetical protein BEK98_27770 [Streptomyces diastatochromogenes]
MSKAFRAVFQRMVQRAWPLPVGSSDVMAMYTHFKAAVSFGKWPRAAYDLDASPLTRHDVTVRYESATGR